MSDSKQQARIFLLTVGAVEGLALWLVTHNTTTLSTDTWRPVVLSVVLASGICLQLIWGHVPSRQALLYTFGTGALVCGPAVWVLSQVRSGLDSDDFRLATFVPSMAVVVLVIVLFAQSAGSAGHWRERYPRWVRALLNTIVAVAGGCLFTGLYWILISLWAGLFKLINIPLFWNLFYSVPFASLTLPIAWSLGLALVREHAHRITNLGNPFLALSKIFLVMISGIGLLFLITLPVTGLAPLWGTRAATPLLLGLAGLGALFLNLVIQDATAPIGFPKPLALLIRAFILSIPIFSAIALYAVGLRINQYGLMPERVWGTFFAASSLLIGCGYSAAALDGRGPFIRLVPLWNMGGALVAAALLLLVHTPLLDPLILSTRNQVNRLISGRQAAASFDFGALWFKLGQVGRKELERLENLTTLPEPAVVRAQLVRLKQSASYWEWSDRSGVSSPLQIQILGGDKELPAPLVEALRANNSQNAKMCLRSAECVAFQMDLDGDGKPEYLVGLPYLLSVFSEPEPKSWKIVGELRPRVAAITKEQLAEAIAKGSLQRTPPAYSNLNVGETLFQFSAP